MIGTTEIIIIAATGVVLFGASALPKFARSIGQAKKELEKGLKEGASDDTDTEVEAKSEVEAEPATAAKTTKKKKKV